MIQASTSLLAAVDCEQQPVLCNSWVVTSPSIYHMFLPKTLPDQSRPATTIRYIPLNHITVTAQEIAAIHTQEKYKETAPYEGYWPVASSEPKS
jgi:hypothetical protein